MSIKNKPISSDFLFQIIISTIILCIIWVLFVLTTPLNTFLIIFSLLLVVFVFIKPLYGLFLLIFIRPTLDIFTSKSIFSFYNYSLNIASLLALVVIVLSAVILIKNFKDIKQIPLKYSILLFISLSFVSIFYSISFSTSLTEWIRILSIFSLYIISFILIKNKIDLRKLIYTIIISTLIPEIIAFYQFFTKTGMTVLGEDVSNRVFGTFSQPNLLAYYLIIPIALLIFSIINGKKYYTKNIFIYLISIFIFIIFALTYTRGAWLVFLIIIFILGITKYKKFLFGTFLSLFLIYLTIPSLNTRINNLFEYKPYSSIQWRIDLWRDGLIYAQEKPIIGYGVGTANKIILDKRGRRFGSSDPHNDYLKILIENGIFGVISYLLIILTLFVNLIRGYKNSNSIFIKNLFILFIGVSIGLYFMSFADNVFRNTTLQWVFWAMIGALFSVYQTSFLQKNSN